MIIEGISPIICKLNQSAKIQHLPEIRAENRNRREFNLRTKPASNRLKFISIGWSKNKWKQIKGPDELRKVLDIQAESIESTLLYGMWLFKKKDTSSDSSEACDSSLKVTRVTVRPEARTLWNMPDFPSWSMASNLLQVLKIKIPPKAIWHFTRSTSVIHMVNFHVSSWNQTSWL